MNPAEIRRRREELIRRHGPWTAENIDLGHGIFTIGTGMIGVAEHRVKRIVQVVSDHARGDLDRLRILDLGSYECGFAIELARRGASVTAVEARERHVEKARFAKDAIGLPNLTIVHGDAREISTLVGERFDVVLCLGLLYHLRAEEAFRLVEQLHGACEDLFVLETQIGLSGPRRATYGGREYRGRLLHENADRGGAALEHGYSFMPTRPSLLNLLHDVGFTSACEVLSPVAPTLAAYRDHITLIARSGVPVEYLRLESERWPERLPRYAVPDQGLYWRLLERWRRGRGGGIAEIFVKTPRA